jgi:predicted PhzF superfamily epimerase YddE/YHI9
VELPLYQVDAFASRPFTGNPAAVIPLKEWIADSLMQGIAMENNLSETAFFVPAPGTLGNIVPGAGTANDGPSDGAPVAPPTSEFHIRWFTPLREINLCGHATLASAYVLFHELGYKEETVVFHSKSGPLRVNREKDGKLTLDFPAWPPRRLVEYPEILADALKEEILGVYQYRDLLVELSDEMAVRRVQPDFTLLGQLQHMVIVTAPGIHADFVSRFFAPSAGIDEDPVTGSAHTQLVPFWGEKLGKKQLYAKQLSRRGGELWCRWAGERVLMSGHCAFFLKGTISIK